MWWRLKRSQFEQLKGERNRQAMQAIVEAGEVPGLLAYAGPDPVGWISVAPRDSFPVLDRSRILKRVDDQPVWSVVCFFIAKKYRGRGMSVRLLKAAIEYVKRQGGRIVEAYPVEPKQKPAPAMFVFTGLVAAFRKVGFREVARRSETRPIMRYQIR
jgi:GNAT superfamily N-acetyltransferase